MSCLLKILTIVPCAQSKIWKKQPKHDPEEARNAYTGAPFKVNKAFAEKFSGKPPDRWVILSAKYGFIEPDFKIENYNVTFKSHFSKPIGINELKEQASEKELEGYELVIALGGKDYSDKVEQVLGKYSRLLTPSAGLPIGIGMSRIKALTRLSRDQMLKEIGEKNE